MSYIVPVCVAIISAVIVLILGEGPPRQKDLPSLEEVMPEEKVVPNIRQTVKAPENMNTFQIFCTYVLCNKSAWYVSPVDIFVYMVCFEMVSWLPIYPLTMKYFSKEQISVVFLLFEWATVPPTLLADWLSNKLFKRRRVLLAMICMALIFIYLISCWKSESLFMVTTSVTIVDRLIYVPQFLASVQTMEIMPGFVIGSTVGSRGFMDCIFGTFLDTGPLGTMVDHIDWHGGFYFLGRGITCCTIFCWLSHRGTIELERHRAVHIKEH